MSRNRSGKGVGSTSAKSRKRQGKARRSARNISHQDTVVSIKHIVVPPKFVTLLRYRSMFNMVNTIAGTASKCYNMIGIYDVDPSLGSTVIPGFTELSTLFGSNRVLRTKVYFKVSNLDSQPYSLCFAYRSGGSQTNNAFVPSLWGNDKSYQYTIGAKTGEDTLSFRKSLKPWEIFGDRSSYMGDIADFVGTSGSNPTATLNLYVATSGVANQTNGVYIDVTIDFEVEFFNRIFQSS